MSRLIPIIALVFALAVVFLYIKPTYTGAIHDTQEQIKSYDAALAAADRFQTKEAQLTQAQSQIPPASLTRLAQFLPNGVDNVQLILDMDALAARSGVQLSDFNIQGVDQGGASQGGAPAAGAAPTANSAQGGTQSGISSFSSTPIDSLNLTFKATGTYTSFRNFLRGVENSLRPLDVINLNISQSQTGVYTYDVTVRIYWLR